MCGKIKLQDYVKRGKVVSGARGKNQGGPTQLKLSGGIPEVFKLVPTDTT